MSNENKRRGSAKGRRPDAPTFRPPPRTAPPRAEEDVDDDVTWAATGSPYAHRENTAEVSFFEEPESTTSVDWNPSSGPASVGSYDDDIFALPMQPRGAYPGEHPTQPEHPPTGPGRAARPPAGLVLPAPRGRPGEAVRPIPPVRRAGNLAEGSGRYAVVTPSSHPTPAVLPPPTRPPAANLVGVLVPVAIASVAVFGLAALAITAFRGVDEAEIQAPMLPVVSGQAGKAAPPPPFDLVPPPPFRPQLIDPSIPADDLPLRMAEARAGEDLPLATALSDRAVRLDVQPARFFAHGKLLADLGEVDAALYWLVRAVQERGVPPSAFVEDRAFRWLWIDDRWDPFIRWVVSSTRFYASRGPNVSTILTPEPEAALRKEAERLGVTAASLAGRKDGLPLPVLVWLDDVGGSGGSALPWGQVLADELGVLVVGVGGPERIGPSAAMWSSDPARDRAQIDDALTNIPGFKADPARRYVAGLGQGGQYAVELVLRDPTFAKGALALGPTDTWRGARDPAGEGTSRVGQVVRIDAGALDPDTHTLARLDRGRLLRADIVTDLRIDANPWADGVPPDLGERVKGWLADLVGPKPPATETTAAVDTPPSTPAEGDAAAPEATPTPVPEPSPATPPAP